MLIKNKKVFSFVLSIKIYLFLISLIFLLFPFKASAEEAYYESYDVTIDFNQDSTFTVTEKVKIYFDGVFKKVYRGITLSDDNASKDCFNTTVLQCGGFDFIEFIGVYDSGNIKRSESEYSIEEVYEQGEKRFKVTWYFDSDGRLFNGEYFEYSIKYKIYGGLGFFDDYDLFYFDMLPPDRPTDINSSKLTFNFPFNYNYSNDNLRVLTNYNGPSLSYSSSFQNNSLLIEANNIKANQDFTVALKIDKGFIKKPGSLIINSNPDPINVVYNGIEIKNVSKKLNGIPEGDFLIMFFADGYEKSIYYDFDIKSGEVKVIEITLNRDPISTIIFIGGLICVSLSCLSAPIGLFLMYLHWRKKGRDAKYRETIVPEYTPPLGIKPYLLGSIKDERVDMIDIVATIIDVARMGYIKIKEFESASILGFSGPKDYELIKLKDFKTLEKNEKFIIEQVFDYKERVVLSRDLKNVFYTRVPKIVKEVDLEMVEKGYYEKSPSEIRSKYTTTGTIIVSTAFTFLICAISTFIFLFPIILPLISLIIIGIGLIIMGKHMPARTLEGSKILNRIQGFRMYLYTAERFRVQDLTPDTFEKFLPYAMVFGIEKEWGERFKDIVKTPPDWFESNTLSVFNTHLFISSISRFTTTSASSLTSSPQRSYGSSSGSIGGGWSGGGGFGGSFGGGGGGGGSSGWG